MALDTKTVDAAPRGGEIVTHRAASGVVHATRLETAVHDVGIEYLMYGMVMDQCVEAAIRDADARGLPVTQIDDRWATKTPEGFRASIKSMRDHYCRTRGTDGMIAELLVAGREGSRQA